MNGETTIYRTGMTLILTLALFILAVYTLEKTGAGRAYGIAVSAIALAGLWLIPAFKGGTTKASRYLREDNRFRAGVNALAMTCLAFPPFLAIAGSSIFFQSTGALIVIAAAVLAGIAGAGLLTAGPLRASGAVDLSDLLAQRYETTAPSRLFAVIVLASGLCLSSAALDAAAYLTSWFFDFDRSLALFIVAIATALPVVVGGIASVVPVAAIAIAVLLAGLNLPLLVHSFNTGGLPIGHLTFGHTALEPVFQLEEQLKEVGIPLLSDVLTSRDPVLHWDSANLVCLGIIITSAIAFSPFANQFHVAATTPGRAGAASVKAILVAGFALLSLIALLAFTRYGIYQFLLGLPISEARYVAPVLYAWSERPVELITLCGNLPGSAEALASACGAQGERIITIADLSINGNLLLAAAPDLAGHAFSSTALMSIGLILAVSAFASAILYSVSGNIMSAFYMTLTDKLESGRIFFIRLLSLALALLASAAVSLYELDVFTLVVLGYSIIASTAPVAMAASLHPATFSGRSLFAAMACGIIVTLAVFVLSSLGMDFTSGTGDEWAVPLPGGPTVLASALSGLVGLLLALTILLAQPVARLASGLLPGQDPRKSDL